MDEFIFSDEPIVSTSAVAIEIPSGVATKEELLTVFNDVLQEAGMTFGMNWDALYDVLTDMSYLVDIANQIVIVHADVPLQDSPEELQSYLGVLVDALDYNSKKMKRRAPLEVYFPEETKEIISRSL